jgi:CTP synthase
MRLGSYECRLQKGTKSFSVYGKDSVSERHRHRYEVNPDYVKTLADNGLIISGTHPKNNIVEIVEWSTHFGVATQPHIELKSRLENPSPIFVEFIKEAKKSSK